MIRENELEVLMLTLQISYTFALFLLIAIGTWIILEEPEISKPSNTVAVPVNTTPSHAEIIDDEVILTLNPNGKGGEYFTKGKIIVIYADALPTYEDALQLFNHEYGHYLFHDRLYWYERTFYEEDVYADANTFVSEYARDCKQWFEYCTRYEEDFAETFAHAMLDGEFNINYVPEDRRAIFRKVEMRLE